MQTTVGNMGQMLQTTVGSIGQILSEKILKPNYDRGQFITPRELACRLRDAIKDIEERENNHPVIRQMKQDIGEGMTQVTKNQVSAPIANLVFQYCRDLEFMLPIRREIYEQRKEKGETIRCSYTLLY